MGGGTERGGRRGNDRDIKIINKFLNEFYREKELSDKKPSFSALYAYTFLALSPFIYRRRDNK